MSLYRDGLALLEKLSRASDEWKGGFDEENEKAE
jgi:hypothetical protein